MAVFPRDALCVGMDPEVFFPLPGDVLGIAAAKAVCAACPVRAFCAEYAVRTGSDDGIFGGLTPDERRDLRALSAA